MKRTLKYSPAVVHEQSRIIWASSGYMPHAIAALPQVPKETVQRIQQAMLNMDKDLEGQALLATIKIKGMEAGNKFKRMEAVA